MHMAEAYNLTRVLTGFVVVFIFTPIFCPIELHKFTFLAEALSTYFTNFLFALSVLLKSFGTIN